MKNTPINEMTLTFPSYSENESLARIAVSGFLSRYDPAIDWLSDVKTAVSEAVTNAIVHGYRDKTGDVSLVIKIFENGEVYIKVRDKGCGIADIRKAMEPLFTTAPEEDRAGLGFAVMESFMESVSVKSSLGKGTTVVMRKKLTLQRRFYGTKNSLS